MKKMYIGCTKLENEVKAVAHLQADDIDTDDAEGLYD
jgi:hypothetical protein